MTRGYKTTVQALALNLGCVGALDRALEDALGAAIDDREKVRNCPVTPGRAGRRFGCAQTRCLPGGFVEPAKITLHPVLLAKAEVRELLVNTFLHEVAHLIAELVHARKVRADRTHPQVTDLFGRFRGPKPSSAGHGPVWARVMHTLGLEPTRCASKEESLLLAAHSPPRAPRRARRVRWEMV